TEQMEGARQSRASDRYHQAGLRLCQSALPRAQKERSSPHCHLRAGQSVYRTPASIALRGGVIYLAWPPAVANVEDVTPITVPPIPNCHCCCNFNGRYPLPAPLFRPSLDEACRCEPAVKCLTLANFFCITESGEPDVDPCHGCRRVHRFSRRQSLTRAGRTRSRRRQSQP